MILQNGTRVRDRYLIESLVGQGGMGAVYRATDLHLGHSVAIKENLLQGGGGTEGHSDSTGQTDSRRSQFEREAQILARLKHPGLPKVTDHFVLPDVGQYLVMEFVEGEDLSSRLKRTGPMTELEAVALIRRVCGILAYLHSQKPPIIHRDIKPANIRQTPEGDIVVVDFGVAKIFSSEATVTAARAVTPGFSPLEQYGGSQSTDERSDIYALGATLHQLVTGKRPPEATTRITQTAGKGLGWIDMPGVSEMLSSVVRKAIELRPEDRYSKISEFARALEAVEEASSFTQTRPAPAGAVSTELAPTAPLAPPPPPALGAATQPATAPPPTAPPPTFVAPPGAAREAPAPPTPPPAATAPPVPSAAPPPPAPAPAYAAPAPPPVAAKETKNRAPLFIGIGVLVLVLAGGGYALFGRGGGEAKRAPGGNQGSDPGLLAARSAGSEPQKTPVDDRANTAALPRADVTETAAPKGPDAGAANSGTARPETATPRTSAPGTPAADGSNRAPASNEVGSGRPARDPGGAPAATPPASSSPASALPGGSPQRTPTPGGAPVGAGSPPPPSRTGDTGSELVPLTDNPGKPPMSHSQGTTGGTPPSSTPSQTPPQAPPPQTSTIPAPVVTPPQTTPPTSGGAANPAPANPTPAVVPVATLGDTLVIDPSGAGTLGSLSDAIQAWKEAYEKDRRVRTLLLKPGTYPRTTTLFMGNAGRLIGSGAPGSVVINYTGSNPGLSLEGADIVVRNITVRSNGKSALSATKGQARIENCEFASSGSHAVQLNGVGVNVTFTRCRMATSAGRGLLLANGTARLDNCDITANQLGVEVSGGALTMTGGSIKENQGTGLRVRGAGRAELSNVTITANARHGVSVEGGSLVLNNCTVTGNTQSGLFCAGGGGRVTISGGDFTRNLTGAIVDSCGAVTKSGSVREK